MRCESVNVQLPDSRAVTVVCVRNPRAKRIKLTVTGRGARLTLPLHTSLAAGAQFVEQHRDWLAAQLNACSGAAPLLHNVTTHLPLRGRQVTVHWQQGHFVQLTEQADALYFSCPANARPETITCALRDFYMASARADIGRWLPKYLPGLPHAPSRIQLRIMSSQWGSLACNGKMSLDLALVLAEPFVFEYVLVHELCHLIYRNHSPQFWNEVQTRCPDWRNSRHYLREHGRYLKAQMYTLLT